LAVFVDSIARKKRVMWVLNRKRSKNDGNNNNNNSCDGTNLRNEGKRKRFKKCIENEIGNFTPLIDVTVIVCYHH